MRRLWSATPLKLLLLLLLLRNPGLLLHVHLQMPLANHFLILLLVLPLSLLEYHLRIRRHSLRWALN